jgi:hypothetical protein
MPCDPYRDPGWAIIVVWDSGWVSVLDRAPKLWHWRHYERPKTFRKIAARLRKLGWKEHTLTRPTPGSHFEKCIERRNKLLCVPEVEKRATIICYHSGWIIVVTPKNQLRQFKRRNKIRALVERLRKIGGWDEERLSNGVSFQRCLRRTKPIQIAKRHAQPVP